ncbi:MAG TPA: Bax inhibitor-1/YccA family protein [Thermoanaerobaculia bacterium]|nr:Bax inhibitor-1/YccA family protein [Thermoanaerobaculia bacterium]
MDDRLRAPQWIDVASPDVQVRERAFIRAAFGWMFLGLLLTAVTAFWVVGSPAMQQMVFNRGAMLGLILVELGAVAFLSFRIQKMSPGVAVSVFLGYAILNGVTLSSICFIYTASSITQAFVVSAGMFGAMSLYGLVTKKDLTSWGSFLFMGVIGIILTSVLNMFVRSSALEGTISLIGVFVFVGLTAYHTQKLKAYATVSGPMSTNFAVIGALSLYLDFVNLFLMLLRLFGGGRRR